MPIRRERAVLYPADWFDISIAAKGRAGWRCQDCGVRHMAWGHRLADGSFVELAQPPLLEAGYRKPPFELQTADGRTLRVIEIVLTTAHLDHDPGNNAESNLRVLCQLHHLRHDHKQHMANAAATRRASMQTLELPLSGRQDRIA